MLLKALMRYGYAFSEAMPQALHILRLIKATYLLVILPFRLPITAPGRSLVWLRMQ
ncbi:MAG: hypothetical protein RBJ76_22210 [Stenomitos frigidus ULC029]